MLYYTVYIIILLILVFVFVIAVKAMTRGIKVKQNLSKNNQYKKYENQKKNNNKN